MTPNLFCKGRDGLTREFTYEFERDPLSEKISFRVYSAPPPISGEFFEMTVVPFGAQTVRVIMMAHNSHSEYRQKGIPDALLPAVRNVLGKAVVSSPATDSQSDVFRTVAATRVWERLRSAGSAVYDAQEDVYRLI